MPSDRPDHAECVAGWLRAAEHLSVPRLVDELERALRALWQRANRTLGEVTLTAIVGRVLYLASERHPFLAVLELESTSFSLDALRAQELEHDRLVSAARSVLVELLTVIGNLTAEILTPALHAELAGLLTERPPAGESANQKPRPRSGSSESGASS